jgi:membrane-bound lytic murein transglycosylase MltF
MLTKAFLLASFEMPYKFHQSAFAKASADKEKQVPENWLLVKCNLRYFTKKKNYDNLLLAV